MKGPKHYITEAIGDIKVILKQEVFDLIKVCRSTQVIINNFKRDSLDTPNLETELQNLILSVITKTLDNPNEYTPVNKLKLLQTVAKIPENSAMQSIYTPQINRDLYKVASSMLNPDIDGLGLAEKIKLITEINRIKALDKQLENNADQENISLFIDKVVKQSLDNNLLYRNLDIQTNLQLIKDSINAYGKSVSKAQGENLYEFIIKIIDHCPANSPLNIYQDILNPLILSISQYKDKNHAKILNDAFYKVFNALNNTTDKQQAFDCYLEILTENKCSKDIQPVLISNIAEILKSEEKCPFITNNYINKLLNYDLFGNRELFNLLTDYDFSANLSKGVQFTKQNVWRAGLHAGIIESAELSQYIENTPQGEVVPLLKAAAIDATDPNAKIIKQIASRFHKPLEQSTKKLMLEKLSNYLKSPQGPSSITENRKQLSALAFEIENPNYSMRFLLNEIIQNAKQIIISEEPLNLIHQAAQESSYDAFKESLETKSYALNIPEHFQEKENNLNLLKLLKEKEILHGKDVLKSAYEAARGLNLTKIHPESGYKGVGKIIHYLESMLEELNKIFGKARNFLTENVQHTIIDFKSVQAQLAQDQKSPKLELLNDIRKSLRSEIDPSYVVSDPIPPTDEKHR